MFAVMNGHLLPGQPAEHAMPGMEMPASGGGWSRQFSGATALLLSDRTARPAVWWLDSAGQTMMAAGMSIAFGAMLFQD
jgi:hypothetical protein